MKELSRVDRQLAGSCCFFDFSPLSFRQASLSHCCLLVATPTPLVALPISSAIKTGSPTRAMHPACCLTKRGPEVVTRHNDFRVQSGAVTRG